MFSLGKIVATPGALREVPQDEVLLALDRYSRGDWGNLCDEDKEQNDYAMENGLRILASYETRRGIKFWITTEADRAYTTILLPSEY